MTGGRRWQSVWAVAVALGRPKPYPGVQGGGKKMVVGIGITILSIGVSDSIGVAESAIFHLMV
jgi:hypothetical protein